MKTIKSHLTAELAKRDERLAALEWRPVSVNPTREDADGNRNVIGWNGFNACFQHVDWKFGSNVTHWLRVSPPPAPTPEEIERREFEEMIAACVPGGQSCDPQSVADNLRAWKAARAAKEGKSV